MKQKSERYYTFWEPEVVRFIEACLNDPLFFRPGARVSISLSSRNTFNYTDSLQVMDMQTNKTTHSLAPNWEHNTEGGTPHHHSYCI